MGAALDAYRAARLLSRLTAASLGSRQALRSHHLEKQGYAGPGSA